MTTKNQRSVLTRAALDKAAPAAKPYRLWDAKVQGLFLRVLRSGAKTWNVAWCRNRTKALGKYPAVTLDAARARALAVLGEAAQGTPEFAKPEPEKEPEPAQPENPTLRVFVDDHYWPIVLKGKRAGQATSDALKAQFGHLYDTPLRAITKRDIAEFVAKRTDAGIKPRTINRDLDRIRAALNVAIEWRMLDTNPAAAAVRPIAGDERVRFLDPSEERRLRAALDQRERRRRGGRARTNAWNAARGIEPRREWGADEYTDYLAPMVLLAMNTGLRRGELFGLEWSAVDLVRRTVKVTAATAKSQRQRRVPLNSEACAVLVRWKGDEARAGLVFPGDDGKRLGSVRKAWTGLAEDARLVDFRFHDLRHHFASVLAMRGVSLNTIRDLMGHAKLETTMIYAHLAPGFRADAVEVIAPSAEQEAGRTAAAQRLIADIGDPEALRTLMQQLAERLEA